MKRKVLLKIQSVAAAVMALSLIIASPFAAFANEWQQEEDGSWYYVDEAGSPRTGWVRPEGEKKWYLLDHETGKWIEKPPVNEQNVCHLLENALADAGLYQNEDYELIYRIVYQDEAGISVSVMYEDRPGYFVSINTYEVSRKTGKAKAPVGDDLFL